MLPILVAPYQLERLRSISMVQAKRALQWLFGAQVVNVERMVSPVMIEDCILIWKGFAAKGPGAVQNAVSVVVA